MQVGERLGIIEPRGLGHEAFDQRQHPVRAINKTGECGAPVGAILDAILVEPGLGSGGVIGRRQPEQCQEAMTIQINGMAHVMLTVSQFDVAHAFHQQLLPHFGMKPVFDGERLFYCVGGRTAIGIQPCDPAHDGERLVQQRVGLHHLCLRARLRDDVDRLAVVLREMSATIIDRRPQPRLRHGRDEFVEHAALTRVSAASSSFLVCWKTRRSGIAMATARGCHREQRGRRRHRAVAETRLA